jgi:hypothetical protein
MKQHITIDQWNEIKLLSPDIPHDMNIGQMIEFLTNGGCQWKHSFDGFVWKIESPDFDDLHYAESGIELCDALWEAVKEVLEKRSKK